MRHISCLLTLTAALTGGNAIAQANILGLPAVPQAAQQPAKQPAAQGAAPAGASASASAKSPKQSASAARTASPAAVPSIGTVQESVNDVEAKSVLSGGVTMASSYEGKVATVRVTTSNVYQGNVYREQAIKAAKLVQRDLVTSCAWQCKPAPMPAPQILADGKLQFAMAIDNYPRVLSYEDMIAMLMGRPLAVAPKAAVSTTVAPPLPAATPVANALPPGVVRSSNLETGTGTAPAR